MNVDVSVIRNITEFGPRTSRATEILELATRLFFEKDYSSVGMRTIASESGVRGATLYHHFSSKEEMLFSIVLEVTRDFITDHLPLLELGGDIEAQIEALVEQHIIYFWKHRYALSVGYREMHNLTPDHQLVVRKYRLQYQKRIQEFIEVGKRAGVFHCEDSQLAGLAILDMVNGINDWFKPVGRLTIEQLAKEYGRLVLQTLGKK